MTHPHEVTRQVLASHLMSNPMTARLYNTDTQFHLSVNLAGHTLEAVVEELQQHLIGSAIDEVLRGTLNRLYTDRLLADREATVAVFAATGPFGVTALCYRCEHASTLHDAGGCITCTCTLPHGGH